MLAGEANFDLCSTWLNSMLVSLEILLMYQYFNRNTGFSALKAGMIVSHCGLPHAYFTKLSFEIHLRQGLLVVDLTSTISDYACVWMYSIAHWGDEAFLANQYWPIPVYLVTTG